MAGDRWAKVQLHILSSEVSLSEITAVIGIAPSFAYRKGDLVTYQTEGPSQRYLANLWVLDSGLPSDESLDQHLDALSRALSDKTGQLESLKSQCALQVLCSRAIKPQDQILIRSSTLRMLTALAVDLHFEVYCVD